MTKKGPGILFQTELTTGDKPEQDVVIVKSGEIPIEEPYRNEL
jgi:hypothetical protein